MFQIRGNNRLENLNLRKVFANQILDGLLEITACFLKRTRQESFNRRANLKDFPSSPNRSLKDDDPTVVLRGLKHSGSKIASGDPATQDNTPEDAIEAKVQVLQVIQTATLPVEHRIRLLPDPFLDAAL
jgi:hypothetical protein